MTNRPAWLTAGPIAHRGLHDFSRGVVENSLGALRAALTHGYGVECDLRLSRDEQVFVFHDDTLDRLCGESGRFDALDASDIGRRRLVGSGEPVPTLAQWLQAADGGGPLVLELKGEFSGDVTLARAVASALDLYRGDVAVKSFDPSLIGFLREAGVPRPLGMVAQSDYEEDEWAQLTGEQRFGLSRFTHAAETRPDFLSWRAGDLPNPVCELARACGVPVMTWTIRSAEQAAAARRHADQIVFERFLP
jgi:glycerophosphoryl diester phosphodiesterase